MDDCGMKRCRPSSRMARYLRLLALGTLWMMAAPAAVEAQIIYQTDFSGDTGALPDDWSIKLKEKGTMALNGTGQLVYTSTEQSGTGIAYWHGDLEGVTDGVMSNATARTLLQWPQQGNNQNIGLLARVQDRSAVDPVGYFAGLSRYSSQNSLVITKSPSGFSRGEVLASVNVSLTQYAYYLLDFTVVGDQLTATLYDPSGQTEIASISIDDSSYSGGVFGLYARSNAVQRQMMFDNFYAEAIPEPSSAAMLFIVGIGAFLLRARFSRRQPFRSHAPTMEP